MPKFTTFDGLQLAYQDAGNGLPLLCLAGLTRTGRDFEYLAPHLPDVRMIRLDYRGRGQSDWADDPMTYSVPVEALDALALLDHLGIEKAALLGNSRGGLIAMAIAATAKNRMIGACLNDIGPVIEPVGLNRIMDYLGREPTYTSQDEMTAAMPVDMAGFANVTTGRWRQEVEKKTKVTTQGLKITYDPALRQAVKAAFDQPVPDLWPLFDAFAGMPIALIRGANSNLLSVETTAEMRRRRPDMGFVNVKDRGHHPFLDEPVAIAVIKTWLEACA